MENYAGDLNRRCKAKTLFAESVMSNMTYQSAARLYGIRNELRIPYIDHDEDIEEMDGNLIHRSTQPLYHGYCFRHPRRQVTIETVGNMVGHDIRKLLSK